MVENPRLLVIETAVGIEKSLSLVLGGFLNIDVRTSRTLGNKPSALGFKQKVDILTDMKTIESSDAKKLQYFAEIRNQFAHNHECKNFVACFDILEVGTKNGIIKIYKNAAIKGDETEEYFKQLFLELNKDVENILLKLISIFSERALLHSKLFQYETFVSLLFDKFNKTVHSTEPFKKVLPIIIKLTDAELKVKMEQNLINYDFPGLNNFTRHIFKNKI